MCSFFFVPADLAVSSQMPVWAPFSLRSPHMLAFHKFSWKSSSLLSPLPGVSSPTHEYISLNPFLSLQTQLPSGHLSINIPEALQTHKSRMKQPSQQPGWSWQIESPTTQLSNIETQHRNELDSFFFFCLFVHLIHHQSINPTSWYLERSTSLYGRSHSSECHLFSHSWSSGIFSGPLPIYSLHRSQRDISGIQTWSSVAKPAMALLTLGRNSLTRLMILCLFPHPQPSRWLHRQACLLPSAELILLSILCLSSLCIFCLY